MSSLPNVDVELERAMAAEAVFDYPAFNASGASPDDFASGECKLVVSAAHSAWEVGDSGLDGTVRALQRDGNLERVGGRQGLQSLMTSGGAPDVARLKLLARLRRLVEIAVDAQRVAASGDLQGALERFQDGATIGMSSERALVKDGGELVWTLLSGLRDKSELEKSSLYPGLRCIADAIGRLPFGSCTVIGADSGVGKSSLALEMIIGVARSGACAGLIGVEDPESVTGSRLLGSLADVDSRRIQTGALSPSDQQRVKSAIVDVNELSPRMLFSDCTGGNDVDIQAAMSQMHARGAKLIAVDYLTEIDCSSKQQDRRNEIRWIAKQLKSHAKRLGVALVLVSQISRPESKNANAKPTKHHLKESGDVTNAAEVIILLWRDVESDESRINAWVAKCKWGGTGKWWAMRRTPNGRLVEDE